MIDDECGAVGGMRIGRGDLSTQRKPTPVPLCSPQIPHNLTRGPPRWEAGDLPPELWHGPLYSVTVEQSSSIQYFPGVLYGAVCIP
jgi:hypothetical protein